MLGVVARGIVPAFTGSSMGHGVRTCAYEASLTALTSLSGGAAELQVITIDSSGNDTSPSMFHCLYDCDWQH